MLPASSPLDMDISVFTVAVFLFRIFTLLEQVLPFAWVSIAMFGYGIGIGGAGGAGVLHTSGKAIHWPPPFVDAGIIEASYPR
jgi:hypothetical protein